LSPQPGAQLEDESKVIEIVESGLSHAKPDPGKLVARAYDPPWPVDMKAELQTRLRREVIGKGT
jgi:hypothetical protein